MGQTEQPLASEQARTLRERSHAIAERAGSLVRQNMELGQHPEHFAQLSSAQGVLVRRSESTLLIRQYDDGGLQVLRGERPSLGGTWSGYNPEGLAIDFGRFMRDHYCFGLEPGTKIASYIDHTGRASILDTDLKFIMDITDPVAAYRDRMEHRRIFDPGEAPTDLWSRSSDPFLLMTHAPGTSSSSLPQAEAFSFPSKTGSRRNSSSAAWRLPMEVVGSFSDETFFRRIRHVNVGATAISGSRSAQSMNYFTMFAITPMARIIEDEGIGYTPLVSPGNSLMLYDTAQQVPIATDARIVGILGNSSQAY